jgi:valyl-tRNA synthetase
LAAGSLIHAGIATQNVVEKALRKKAVMLASATTSGAQALVRENLGLEENYGGLILQHIAAHSARR